MTTLSSNVDATTNLQKILATGRNRDGPPHKNALLRISTGLPYYLSVILNIPVYNCKHMLVTSTSNVYCVLQKAIYFAWSQHWMRTDQALIISPWCNDPCRPKWPTFILWAKFFRTNNDASKSSHSFCKTTDTCDSFTIHTLVDRQKGRQVIWILSPNLI